MYDDNDDDSSSLGFILFNFGLVIVIFSILVFYA